MIDLTPAERETVIRILDARVPGVPRAVFGSRTGPRTKRFSDIDLLLRAETPLEPTLRDMLREDFSDSDLRFRVDILDAANADPSFLELIKGDLIPLE